MQASVSPQASQLYEKFRVLDEPAWYSAEACARFAAVIDAIRHLKEERRAVILCHNYQRPEIFEVADFVGDSLELAQKAATTDASVIVFCGVHFMAETAKLLNPHKTVLLPDLRAGCSLADSIEPEDLAERKEELQRVYPDLQVVAYVNTSAAVKALVDVCCTSSNAVKVVNSLPSQHILFVPDRHLAEYVQQHTSKQILSWDGACYVHHQITPESIREVRAKLPNVKVLVHPECRADVAAEADAVLSTSGMVRYAKTSEAREFLIVTECGLSDRLFLEAPEKRFYKACKLCQFMKMITLEGTRQALEKMQYEIVLEEDVRRGAERALRRMLELSN